MDTLRSHIQFTAPVSPGSSGGAIFNGFGELIGIVTLQMTEGQNLNFGVPINDARPLLSGGRPLRLRDISGFVEAGSQEPESFEGIWNGIVSNFSHGASSALQITLRRSGAEVSGEVLISRPLFGSGPLVGHVEGKTIRFRSEGEGFVIEWEGEYSGARITGSYTVVKRFFSQRGTWWVVK